MFASPSWSPFTLYSCVTHGFASVDFDRENNVAGRDLQGNTYTQQQFDSILPTFYYRQLAAEGRFPSEIEGVAVESRDVERTNFMFRTSPGEINRRRPTVYQLLESMPDRIDLEPATDVFRITGEGIEFVDMETNTIDQKKSAAFTKVLRDKGFSFPARVVSGNPSTRKRYDNGYLLVDDAQRVYHMKQVRGRPFVRRTDVADSLQIGQIFVTEFADRKSLGFLVDSEKRFYTLGAEDYKLHMVTVLDQEQCDAIKAAPADPADVCCMIHLKGFASLTGGLQAADQAQNAENSATTVQMVSVLFSIVIAALLTSAGSIWELSVATVLMYQAAWSALSIAVCALKQHN